MDCEWEKHRHNECSISWLNKKTKVLSKISFQHKGLSSDLFLSIFLYQMI